MHIVIGGIKICFMKNEYEHIIVESFIPEDLSGRHGEVHIRPLPNQAPYLESYFVQCSKELSRDYPVGTQFRIRAKLTNKEGRKTFITSHYTWSYEVLQ